MLRLRCLQTARCAALLTLLAAAPLLHTQPPVLNNSPTAPDYVPTLAFDVATIRESGPTEGHGLRVGVTNPIHSSRLEVTNFTAKALIQLAYGFGTPIDGGPDWLGDHYYNVTAKSDAATDAKLATLTDDQAKLEKQHMLQVLLADRLGLKYHMETRESSVHNLLVAKGGPKLKPAAVADPADSGDPAHPTLAATPAADVQAHGGQHGLEFVVRYMSTKAIAAMLSSQVAGPVIDQTGLTGVYDFTLQMGREWSANDPDSWPDIYTALQEQLGLRLEATKASIPNLIIDHIEQPSAN